MQCHVAEEGVNGGKAHIPAAGTVIALVFEMVEESTEESGVEVRQIDVRRRLAQQPLGMGQQ
jgi:hypothetical protein